MDDTSLAICNILHVCISMLSVGLGVVIHFCALIAIVLSTSVVVNFMRMNNIFLY